MYIIKSIGYQKNLKIANATCDSVDDLVALAEILEKGSSVYIAGVGAEQGNTYILNESKTWIAQPKTNSGSGGVESHEELSGRGSDNQHPISSITDLQAELDGKASNSALTDLATEDYVDASISALIGGAVPETLDTLKEIADALQDEESATASILTQLTNKVDKESGKGLSTNDFTNELKSELENIDTTYATKTELQAVEDTIPTNTSELTNDSNFVVDANYVHTDNNYTTDEKTKLASLENYDDTGVLEDMIELQTELSQKQNILIAGNGIQIDTSTNIISNTYSIDAYTKEESNNLFLKKEVVESTTYTNLFDKDSSNLVVGQYTPTASAVETFVNYAQYAVTDYIPATKGDKITSSYIAWETAGFYDADKNRIGGLRQPYSHTAPDDFIVGETSTSSDQLIFATGKTADDIAFIRVNIKFADVNVGDQPPSTPLDQAMIVKNTDYPPTYVPFGQPLVVAGKEIAPTLTILPENIEDGTIPLSKLEEIPSTQKTSFKNKSVLITGDSITQASGMTGWVDLIRSWTDFENVYNDGKSGTGIVSDYNGTPSIMKRYESWEADYGEFDYIVINGNMNDSKTQGFLLGEFNDGADIMTSQYSALQTLFESLIEKYPLKQIVFIISTPRKNSYANDTYIGSVAYNPYLETDYSWGITSWFEAYCTAILEVCAHYGIPVLDLYHESGLRPYNNTYNSTMFVSSDGTHPNEQGHLIMANKILPFLERNLGDNNE